MTATFRAGLHLGLEGADKVASGLQALDKRLTRTERSALRVADALETSGQRLRNAGLALTAGGVAVGAGLYSGVRAAAEFEESMTDVEKVLRGVSGEEFAGFRRDLRDMAVQSRLTHEEHAGIAAAGGQRGIAFSDLAEYTRLVEQASVAYEVSAESAGDSVAVLRNQFSLGVKDLRPVLDALNELSDTSDARAADLLEFTRRAGGVAAQMKMTAQEVGVLGTEFLALGDPPETAGRAFTTLVSRLATGEAQSKTAQRAIQGLGLDVAELGRLTQRDGTEGVLSFLEAVRDSENPVAALSLIVGQDFADNLAGILPRLEGARERLKEYGAEAAYAGSLTDEYGRKMGTLNAFLGVTRNQLRDVRITVGDALTPALKAGSARLGAFVNRFREYARANPAVVRGLVLVTAAFSAAAVAGGVLLTTLGLTAQGAAVALRAYAGLSVRLRLLRGHYLTALVAARSYAVAEGAATAASLRGAGALTILGAAARARAAAALVSLRAAAFAAAVSLVALPIRAAVAADAFARQAVAVLSSRAALVSFARGAVASVVGSLAAATKAALAFSAALLANPLTWVAAGVVAAAVLVYKYWKPLKAFFGGVFDGLREALAPALGELRPLLDGLRSVASAAGRFFSGLLRQSDPSAESLGRIAAAGRTVGRVLGATLVPAVRLVAGTISGVVSVARALWPALKLIGAGIRLAFQISPLGLFLSAIRGAFAAIKALTSGGSWKDAGRALIRGIASGIKSAAGALFDAAKSALAPLRRLVPGSPVREGPLTAYNTAGKSLMDLAASSVTPRPLARALTGAFREAARAADRPAVPALRLAPRVSAERPDLPGLRSRTPAPLGAGVAPLSPSPRPGSAPAPSGGLSLTLNVDARGASPEAEAAVRRGAEAAVPRLEEAVRRVVRDMERERRRVSFADYE
jgi:TP901 family phage tail tape measure protein